MEIKQLMTFYTVAREMSFSQAANVLNYAQPTITAHIQNLEQELGIPLFNRLSSGISLTPAGERLLTYAENMIRMEGEARAAVSQSASEPDGDLLICVSGSILSYHLPPVLQQFNTDNPQVNIKLVPSLHCDIVEVVEQGEADLGLVYRQVLPTTIDYIRLTDEPLILVAGAVHPLVAEDCIEPHQFEQHTLLHLAHSCPFRELIDGIFEDANISVQVNYEFFEYDSIKQYLRNGTGIAILPETVIKHDLDSGDVVRLQWFQSNLTIPIWVIWHRQKWKSPAMQIFRDMVVDELGQQVKTPMTFEIE